MGINEIANFKLKLFSCFGFGSPRHSYSTFTCGRVIAGFSVLIFTAAIQPASRAY